MSNVNASVTDEELTAYLDGELPPEKHAAVEAALRDNPSVQERLEGLRLPDGLLGQAFDLDALGGPAMPAALHEKIKSTAAPSSANTNKAPRIIWPATLAASFALGMLVMSTLRPGPDANWVDIVASYQALYVTETLAGAPQSREMTYSVLKRAQDEFGVDLEGVLEIEGLTFKRAQMLSLDGAPLIQMAYLDAQGQPFAFCLTPQKADDRGNQTRMSFDLATSSWVEDGIGYVLVGGQDDALTRAIATRFRRAI
ncbi:hypothetical protein CEP88_09420 [Roseobacter denitrificans]|uniref:Putative zinc-finger domain-containing protein n=1 Tax=Roseobacter denitrificans (strain ATCC 33942 / OCh 114) TaxID=375451 RepID=Q160W0_ROSDO|nr:hypothetical protein [Roseobacter denitrificans]ABG33483.1 conserved hypothetical protein [Roseobacter denitrificans OCh 114]AVL52798.1 hypothetical protein CEP88_09420 [Roseobacter denitrificans]SFG05356.1 Transmembrane transcriptional regulator (anti-sigma factor RsiW) [Roseobacter denitrificans OCh 114]